MSGPENKGVPSGSPAFAATSTELRRRDMPRVVVHGWRGQPCGHGRLTMVAGVEAAPWLYLRETLRAMPDQAPKAGELAVISRRAALPQEDRERFVCVVVDVAPDFWRVGDGPGETVMLPKTEYDAARVVSVQANLDDATGRFAEVMPSHFAA